MKKECQNFKDASIWFLSKAAVYLIVDQSSQFLACRYIRNGSKCQRNNFFEKLKNAYFIAILPFWPIWGSTYVQGDSCPTPQKIQIWSFQDWITIVLAVKSSHGLLISQLFSFYWLSNFTTKFRNCWNSQILESLQRDQYL